MQIALYQTVVLPGAPGLTLQLEHSWSAAWWHFLGIERMGSDKISWRCLWTVAVSVFELLPA